MHDERCGCKGSIWAYNTLGHEVKLEIPTEQEVGHGIQERGDVPCGAPGV